MPILDEKTPETLNVNYQNDAYLRSTIISCRVRILEVALHTASRGSEAFQSPPYDHVREGEKLYAKWCQLVGLTDA